MSNSRSDPPTPVSDSPWFWVLLFSLAALFALIVVGPKFQRREEIIEAKFHGRERATGREPMPMPLDDAPPELPDWKPIFTLGPIAAVLGGIAILSLVKLTLLHKRMRFNSRFRPTINSPGSRITRTDH